MTFPSLRNGPSYPLVWRSSASGTVGEFVSSAFNSVVFPAPFRPINAIFSPRVTLAVKPRMTWLSPYDLLTFSSSRMCLPEGRFCSNFR